MEDERNEYAGRSPIPKGVLMNCSKGNFVDLSNMPSNGSILASVNIDTTRLTNPMVKIDFNCIISYTLVVLEELDLVFTLYRYDSRFAEMPEMQQIASWPFKLIMGQNVTGTQEYIYTTLQKDEAFTLSYCDQPSTSGRYNYVLKVETNYFNVTSAVIQPGFISIIAQSNYC